MIRPIDPAMADVALTGVGLGETVSIVGENLGSTYAIMVNGFSIPVRSTFVTETHVVFTIPDETPSVVTHDESELSNELVLETKGGKITMPITVLPPNPQVLRISNELAKGGDEITVSGNYLFYVQDVIFPGGIKATAFEAAADGKMIKVTVPEGITEAGTVTVVTQSGEDDALPLQTFNDRTGMLLDWDDFVFWQNWGVSPGVEAGDFNGNFLHISAPGPINPESWWVATSAFVADGVQDTEGITPQNLTGPAGDYVLRMEINVPASHPWTSGWFDLENGNDDYFGRLMPWTDGIFFPDAEDVGTSAFHTNGKWMTIDYPLSAMAAKTDGNPDPQKAVKSIEDMLTDGKFEVRFAFQNPGAGENGGTAIKNGLDISFDNIRVVKVK